MASTFATRLQTDAHNLRMFVTIQGIENVFQDDDVDVPAAIIASGRTRTKLITAIQQGETRMNLAARRIEGGSLSIRMVDDDAGTLHGLFASVRSRRKTFVVPGTGAFESASDTTINVDSTARLASSGTVYIGGETITYTSTTATTLINCTRGAYDSTAQKHYGGTEDGAGVYDVPVSWIGRRVVLFGYFINENGTSTSALYRRLGTFMIESQPRHLGDAEWELQCAELSDEFAEKKIGAGLVDVEPPNDAGVWMIASATSTRNVEVGAGYNYNQFVVGDAATYVRFVLDNDDVVIYRLVGQVDDADDDTIQINTDEQLVRPAPSVWGPYAVSARHIAVLRGSAATILRRVLASRTGNGDNGASDVLPGAVRTERGGKEWRFGAGIDSGEIDFTSILNNGFARQWSYVIDEEISLSDFLFDFCLATDTAWTVSRAGKLTIIPLSEDGASSQLAIDEGMIVERTPVRVEHDESAIVPRVHLECNYDPITQRYLARVNVVDAEIQAQYPNREAAIEVRSRSLVINEAPLGGPNGTVARPGMARPEVETRLRRLQASDQRGRGYVHMTCHLSVLAAEVGEVVTVTCANVPDLEGGSSLSGQLCRVVAMRPRYDNGEVDITLQLIDVLHRVAPAATIASAAGATLTLTTTGPEVVDGQPGQMFGDGWLVQVWDVSTGTVEAHQVLSHTNTTITLDSALGFAVEADKDFIRIDVYGLNSGLSATDNGYIADDFLYQMPDDEYDIEAFGSIITRWR